MEEDWTLDPTTTKGDHKFVALGRTNGVGIIPVQPNNDE